MDKIDNFILKLAEKHKENPEKFINAIIENLSFEADKEGNLFIHIGGLLSNSSYFQLATKSLEHALEYFIQNKEIRGKAICYMNLGYICANLNDFNKAIESFENSLRLFKDVNDMDSEAKCYTNLGIAYANLGDFNQAIEYHEKSLKIFRNMDDKVGKSKCYANLGYSYYNLGYFNKAFKYNNKSIEITETIESNIALAKYYGKSGLFGFIHDLVQPHPKPKDFINQIENFPTPACGKGYLFLDIGVILSGFSYFKLSLVSCEHALEYFNQNKDREGVAKCYINLGGAHYGLGNFNKAIEFLEKSLEICKDINYRFGESGCYRNLGATYGDLGNFNKAIELHKKSLEISKEIDDKEGESAACMHLGIIYEGLGNFNKAIELYEKSLEISERTDNRPSMAKCYDNLGGVYHNLGNYNKALEFFEKSLEINKSICNLSGESKCYNNLGIAYADLGDFKKAIEYQNKALKNFKCIGDKAGESTCYTSLGTDYYRLCKFKKAIGLYEKSLEIANDIGDIIGESKCYSGLGSAYDGLGNFNKAIGYHEKSLEIAKDMGDIVGEAKSYGNLGIAYDNLGDFNKGIGYHEKSLEIKKDIGDRSGAAKCYVGLGNVYLHLGDFDMAIRYNKKSIEIFKDTGEQLGESIGYINLGAAYANLGEEYSNLEYINKSLEYYNKSLKIKKDIGDKTGESKCYTGLGSIYFILEDPDKAIEYHEKALKIAKDIGDKSDEPKCYLNLGAAYAELGDFNKAIEFHEKSLELIKNISDKVGESFVLGNLAYIYYQNQVDYQKSLKYAMDSITISENVRESLIEEKLRDPSMLFFKSKFKVYDIGINAALKLYENTNKQNYLKETFEIIEKTKSRELLKKLNLKEKIHEKPEDIKFDAVERFREVINDKPDCSVLEIYQQSDRVIYLLLTKNKIKLYEQKIDIEVLEELIGEYFTVTTYLFNKLDRENHEEFNEIIENKSDPFLNKLIGKYGRDKVISMMSKVSTFYDILNEVITYIVPEKLRTDLDSIKADYLIVLPHRWLHDISWEAAVINKKPLGLKYNLIRNYNLDLVTSNLNYSHHQFKNALIAFNLYKKENGLKTYPEILENECIAVKNKLKNYEVKYFSKEHATWDNIKKDLHDASLVHFHCHGSFSPEKPLESSGIELYRDHFISAKDILSERIEFKNHPIILLRGCKTGRTGTDNIGTMGDEQMGLVTSFFTAKASTLIVTGWSTYTEYGKEFSNHFYDSLLDGKNVAESLRNAREKIYEKFGNQSRDWAAYMLYGNPFKFI